MVKTNQILIKKILEQVKKHKKYSSISDDVVLDEIKKHLKSNPDLTLIEGKVESIRKPSGCLRQLIKDIRKELHLSYSSFQTKKKSQRQRYLQELKENSDNWIDDESTKKLLSITLSTKERLNDYKKLYKQIFEITGKPSSIIDLGCGLNPISFPYMRLERVKYLAFDIDEDDKNFLNDYFKIVNSHKLSGRAEILNLRNTSSVSNLPTTDIIFLFKVIDVIDKKNHKLSEEIIKKLIKKSKFIVASFATKTITRKKMNFPKRKWFELMLSRNNLKFKTIETENEIFYVIFS